MLIPSPIQIPVTQLTDQELIAHFSDLVIGEREQLVKQLEHILEMDRRKLTFHYSSLWAYLVEEHGLEECSAERRIRAARVMGRIPALKGLFESGKMNLSLLEIALSCARREKLSDGELLEVIQGISGMTCRSAKREIAHRYPEGVEIPSDRVSPWHSGFSEVTFYASEELMNKLEEIRGLLASSYSQMQMRELLAVLVNDFYERHHPESKARRAKEREEKKKVNEGSPKEESPSSTRVEKETGPTASPELKLDIEVKGRRFPLPIVHAMTQRDGYRCSYLDPVTGQTCSSAFNLQKDHIASWFSGGKTSLSNARYLCATHHRRISYLEFGNISKFIGKNRQKISKQ